MNSEKAFCCEECGFPFFQAGEFPVCPFCEGRHCRPATEEETEYLKRVLNTNEPAK